MLSAIRESASPRTAAHTHGVENVASSCIPREPWLSRKSAIRSIPPSISTPNTTHSVTTTPAAMMRTRCLSAMTMARSTAAGHTLIHVAMLSSADPATGWRTAYSRPMNTIGAATPSTRAKLRYPRNTVKTTHHHPANTPLRGARWSRNHMATAFNAVIMSVHARR